MALDLSITRDKTAVYFITVVQSDGTAQPLAGTVLYFHAAVGGVTIDKHSPSSGIVITDAPGGLATLTITPADTVDISQYGVCSGPCELTLAAGSAAYELNSGSITVSPNVSTP